MAAASSLRISSGVNTSVSLGRMLATGTSESPSQSRGRYRLPAHHAAYAAYAADAAYAAYAAADYAADAYARTSERKWQADKIREMWGEWSDEWSKEVDK